MTTLAKPVLLAAGGTAGHVFPAQALAEQLLARGHALALVTDRRGAGYEGVLGRIDTYPIAAARIGGGIVGITRGVAALARGLIQARRLLKRLSPGAVIGFGGYPSLAAMIMASRAGLPTMIHEQNAVMGRANSLLAPRVQRIATSFAAVAGIRARDAAKTARTGNPVRVAIAALAERGYAPPQPPAGTINLLATGGSQGAQVLGEVVPQAVARLSADLRGRLAVSQQCRAAQLDTARAAYRECGVKAEVETFFDDIAERLAAAHLVIGRAGASTVAELTAAGRPAILVPYPFATDDHQRANARAIEVAGGAWLMDEDTLTADALAARLEALLNDPETLARAAAASRETGRPDAASKLADEVERLLGSGDDQTRERAA